MDPCESHNFMDVSESLSLSKFRNVQSSTHLQKCHDLVPTVDCIDLYTLSMS